MNVLCTVVAAMVGAAIILGLLWWAFGRSHQLASQGQSAAGNPTELSESKHQAEANDKAPSEVESQSRKM